MSIQDALPTLKLAHSAFWFMVEEWPEVKQKEMLEMKKRFELVHSLHGGDDSEIASIAASLFALELIFRANPTDYIDIPAFEGDPDWVKGRCKLKRECTCRITESKGCRNWVTRP